MILGRISTIAATPNHALQQTAPAVTLAASGLRLSPAMQPARQPSQSLNMNTCPKCSSANITLSDGTIWTAFCSDCGHSFGGTASFALHQIEVEHEYDVTFQLSSPKQIPSIRAIAPEISDLSTADLLRSARANGLKITIPSVMMWRARN